MWLTFESRVMADVSVDNVRAISVAFDAHLYQPFIEKAIFFEGGKHFWVCFLSTVTLRVTNRHRFGHGWLTFLSIFSGNGNPSGDSHE